MSNSTQDSPPSRTLAESTCTQPAVVNASPAQASLQNATRLNKPGPHAPPQKPNDRGLSLAIIRYLQEPARAGGSVYNIIQEASRAWGDLEEIIDALGV